MLHGFEPLGRAANAEAPEDRVALAGTSEMEASWVVVIYTATHEYISRTEDSPNNAMFLGTLRKAFRIERSVLSGDRLGEQVTIGVGEITLVNTERNYDFLAVDHTAQGQRVEIRIGDRRLPYSTWKVVFRGFVTEIATGLDEITFTLRDAGHQMDVPLSPNLYAGTGGTEGGEDLKDKRKPRAFGWIENWTATLVIPNALAYQLNDGPIHAVQNVYVRGAALTFAADFPSVADLIAASLEIGQYATCLAAGWIRIAVASEAETGQVTADFAGDATDGFVDTAVGIVRRMLGVTTIRDPQDLAVQSFLALDAAQPAPVGFGIPAGDDTTVAVAASRLMAGIGGWIGAKRSGRFEVRRLEAPESGVPAGRYSRRNVGGVRVIPMPRDLSPPPWRIRVGHGRNWTPGQTDLAGSVSEERRAWLAEEVRFATAENTAVRDDFPPGHELMRGETYFREAADAEAEAQRLGQLYWPGRTLYVFPLSERLFIHDPGQVLTLQYQDRLDLQQEKPLRIVRVNEDDREGVEVTAMG